MAGAEAAEVVAVEAAGVVEAAEEEEVAAAGDHLWS